MRKQQKASSKNSLPPTGLEPAIPGLGGRWPYPLGHGGVYKRRLNNECLLCSFV